MKKMFMSRLNNLLPWLSLVNKKTLKADFLAGLTGAVIVLPQGIAFAYIAGLPPVYGLYTAMVTPIIAALFGSSYHLISGPTTAISIVVYSSVIQYHQAFTPQFVELALVLTFLAGLFQFVLGVVRMGTLVNFVSHSVVVGFTTGAAILIILSQLGNLFGIGSIEALGQMLQGMHLDQLNLKALIIGLSTLLTAVIVKKIHPRLPFLVIALISGSIVGILLNNEGHQVQVIGEIPSKLPPFKVPAFNLGTLQVLTPNAFAIALLGLIEAVAIGRSIGAKSGQRIDGNQEFRGQGLSNLVGSFFSCYAGSGSFTRSGINYQVGAKTPMAAIFAAGFLMLIVKLTAPLFAWLPIPAIAGIIVIVAINLIDIRQVKQILRASWAEASVLSITFIATLTLKLEFAIYFGVFFSLIFYLQRTSTPRIVILAPDPQAPKRKFGNVALNHLPECPQLKVVRIDGSIFFGAVDHIDVVMSEIRKGPEKNLLIIASGINLIDVSGAEFLLDEKERWQAKGGQLYLSGLKYRVREFLKKANYWNKLGEEQLFVSKAEAISQIFRKLEPGICQNCDKRIFWECKELESAPKQEQLT